MAPTVQAPLFSFISDQTLALLLPIVVYWTYSLLFHWISLQEFPWFEKYRIHSKEEETRNRVALPDVIKAVIVQQLLQTALGFLAVLADDSQVVFDDELNISQYHTRISYLLSLLGFRAFIPDSTIATLAHICYYYLETLFRFSVAMALLDTWQYFLHRLFHNVPFLYKHFHSRHHRLYVTYAFGALYNHPFEGFLMDSVGASLAFLISGMGNRGALAFFSFSTLKTLDDHCGYNLPFNPLQQLFSNNADYHDIHHQHFGIKSNFSQPFGTFWDHILGTHMSREEANEIIRKKEERKAARAFGVKSSVPLDRCRDEDVHVHGSGNNSGCDSHVETEDDDEGDAGEHSLEDQSWSRKLSNDASWNVATSLRQRLLTRAQLDNGLVSGKGQGKAL